MEDENRFGDVISPEEHPTDAAISDSGLDVEEEASGTVYHQDDAQLPVEVDAADDSSQADALSPSHHTDSPPIDADALKNLERKIESIEGIEQRLFSEVREMHKLYHSEFAGRLKAMQDELEQYRKIDKGRAYDDILAAIARIYGNNETLADEVTEPKAKKSIRYMLMDIEDLLSVYGMEKLRSKPGEKRNPRHCQILGRVPTADPSKHDTVAKSYNSGFNIGNRTVIKEVVDIYIYEGSASIGEADEGQIIEAGDTPVAE